MFPKTCATTQKHKKRLKHIQFKQPTQLSKFRQINNYACIQQWLMLHLGSWELNYWTRNSLFWLLSKVVNSLEGTRTKLLLLTTLWYDCSRKNV